jgi:hypothetical protein
MLLRRQNKSSVNSEVSEIHHKYLPLLKQYSPNGSYQEFERELWDIFSDAILLDSDLKTQIADLYVDWQPASPELRFDPRCMDEWIPAENRDGRKPQVRLVLRPSLWRRGNSEGTGYDQEIPVCRARVSCLVSATFGP